MDKVYLYYLSFASLEKKSDKKNRWGSSILSFASLKKKTGKKNR